MADTSTLTPTNGVDRCYCGCKYWQDVDRCADCGDRFQPPVRGTVRSHGGIDGGVVTLLVHYDLGYPAVSRGARPAGVPMQVELDWNGGCWDFYLPGAERRFDRFGAAMKCWAPAP